MITVMTPTYNRAHTLPQCYESLCKQTSQAFLWLIIDDGSSDNTKEMVDFWIKEEKIKIKYLNKENGGKASALNMALEYLDTPYCVCLDSDDYFTEDAIKKALILLEKEKDNENCCGVIALRNNPDGSVMGGRKIPDSYKYATGVDLMLTLGLRTEYIEFMKSDLAKKFPYPVFEGERFMPPAYVDYMITDDHKFLVSQESFCVCEYIGDGLTKNKRMVIVKNSKGYTFMKRMSYERAITLKAKIKNGIMYDCGCIVGKDKDWLKNAPYKLLTVILWPVGYMAYIKRFRKLQKR